MSTSKVMIGRGEEDSKWMPILRGDVFCSPRCGGGCKKSKYDRAVEESEKLAAAMGAGWTPEVWENLGWHYAVTKGVATVSPVVDRSERGKVAISGYYCSINSAHQISARANTPEDALGFATQDARTVVRRITDDLRDISDDK